MQICQWYRIPHCVFKIGIVLYLKSFLSSASTTNTKNIMFYPRSSDNSTPSNIAGFSTEERGFNIAIHGNMVSTLGLDADPLGFLCKRIPND